MAGYGPGASLGCTLIDDILYQDGHEQMRAAMDDTDALLPLLTRFFAHERQEIACRSSDNLRHMAVLCR